MENLSPQEQLNRITADFKNQFGELNKDQINLKPTPRGWSIGQIIDHIITINKTYFPVFGNILNGNNRTPFIGRVRFFVNLFGNLILKSTLPSTVKKTQTIPIWEPKESDIDNHIFDEFEEHQGALIQWIDRLEVIDKRNTVISSPANKYIVYDLEKALEIIVQHELRHYQQALKIKEDLIQN